MALADRAIAAAKRPGPECLLASLRRTDPDIHADLVDAIDRLKAQEADLHATEVARQFNDVYAPRYITKDFLYRHIADGCVSCR
jgi:hypothetical protein